ncbi:alpha/beta fold hydrolase [Pleionea sediminis]|uniref:alpha/beta fold hydrolase n=1 Tax=Pleionea sediminis TaxID=2569479 RepID=UPI001186DC96|nr:alpha/beta fold hydrolase [Pleionea sediminis]
MYQESLFVPVADHQLHLRHIWRDNGGAPVLMLHGAIENGKIFYTESNKGLGSFLARQGLDVFVADFRGRGQSQPSLYESQNHGQYHSITEDIPALIEFIHQQTNQPVHIVCHSWGGVLAASTMVRFPELRSKIKSYLCFGTKRQITVWNFERLLKISLIWKRFSPWIAKRKGYLDAKKLKIGSDGETLDTLKEGVSWVKIGPWQDPVDSFDYESAAKHYDWPPTWHITGLKDKALGHEKDVKVFMAECHNPDADFSLLSKATGNHVDYDHINILTHPKSEMDHFPKVAAWLNKH